MKDVIQIEDRWYVLATSSRADDRTRVLKHGDTFAVFDAYGNIHHMGIGEQGLYHDGTRFLSHYEFNINGRRPMLLNSTVKEDNSLLTVDLTTPDLYYGDQLAIPKGTLHIFRAILLWEGVHYEHLRFSNYGEDEMTVDAAFDFDADYADIFEVRGQQRASRGNTLPVEIDNRGLVLGYRGLDQVIRRTRIRFTTEAADLGEKQARFRIPLAQSATQDFYLHIACHREPAQETLIRYEHALGRYADAIRDSSRSVGRVVTSNQRFNAWINRSSADLQMLTTVTPHGAYPYAGVPWYSTPFGRDGIITALQYLWLAPELGRGVLAYLAATQAEQVDAARDAEPGKILHETRTGEMAALGEVPFARYYGTVDATPLFVMLAGAYFQRTGDRPFIASIWDSIERALDWIDRYGDSDGDGFVEYARHSSNGLLHQGWKDSFDAVFHKDGAPAQPPIALCEVQAYVYQAKRAAALLAEALGDRDRATLLRQQSDDLKRRFNDAFWSPEIGTYALALDGTKRQCRIRSSNAGQALYTGIVAPERARRIAHALLSVDGFTGWGIRTIAAGEARYNPMSYHNGSVWPHDNALIAFGLARYGLKNGTIRILTGLFEASSALELNRLPELFCGFDRLPGLGPTLYPVACSPQAWASGAVFMLLQACLGLSFSPDKPQLRFRHPRLPRYLTSLEIRNLQVAGASVDLALTRHPNDVSVHVMRKQGDIDIAVIV